jgi:hypothetical protein
MLQHHLPCPITLQVGRERRLGAQADPNIIHPTGIQLVLHNWGLTYGGLRTIAIWVQARCDDTSCPRALIVGVAVASLPPSLVLDGCRITRNICAMGGAGVNIELLSR